MAIKVGINGFGRIGRLFFRAALKNSNVEIVGINDPFIDAEYMVYMLKYDTVHGRFKGDACVKDGKFVVNGKAISVYAAMKAEEIPWKDCGAEYILESTGVYTELAKAEAHIKAGAKRVLISAPSKDAPMFVMGVNCDKYKGEAIVSNASCTTNCLAPFTKVLHDAFKVKRGLMTTIHSYTNDQRILDLSHKDLRRARAAAVSMVPTTTGAAKAVGLVLPELKGKLNGFSLRVPTPDVSVVDLVAEIEKKATVEEINAVLKEAAEGKMKGILGYSDEPLVSIDYRGNPLSSIVDGLSTMVMEDNLVKVLSWYDNEWGFSCRMIDLVKLVAKSL